MILRKRQQLFVDRSLAALKEHGNTLGVASTGFGKTIALSAVVGRYVETPEPKICVLAHRDELVYQNRQKFQQMVPTATTSLVNAQEKSWAGQVTFAMVQTLARQSNLKQIPHLDLLVIDEAHHAAAPTYHHVIDSIREINPKVDLYGVTATPGRGDGKTLRPLFSNVADQVGMGELIRDGHLVPPRTFVIDVGTQGALLQVKRTSDDFDMAAVADIMDKRVINDAVVAHWRKLGGNRKTIVFCSTVDHARHVCQRFVDDGIRAALIHGELSSAERKAYLEAFDRKDLQVLVNCFVLTEGFDSQPLSCVVLLRPSSQHSTYIQCVGRGLRTVDPNEHPGVVKTDCIVLDFGTATLMHGSLEQEVDLDGHAPGGDAPTKHCPSCTALVPLACPECPLCGFVWEQEQDASETAVDSVLTDFVMTEIDLLKRSHFRWCDLFGHDDALMASGFNAWGGVFFLHGRWYAVGGGKECQTQLLAVGERTVCLARANDWLNDKESADSAHKTRRWLNEPPTEKQLRFLSPALRQDFGLTRYQASALLSFQFNKAAIQRLVLTAHAAAREAA